MKPQSELETVRLELAVARAELQQARRERAAMADENALLSEEVEARTRELEESLAQQMATADVLKVISRSVFDLDSVLQTLIDTAVRLTRGSRGTIFIKQAEVLIARAFHSNVPEELRNYLSATRWALDGDSHMARAARERAIVHVPDLSSSQVESDKEVKQRASFGAGLWIPLMREGEAIGVFGVPRDEPVAFSKREIELVQTFADQAVIAIENARLFEQVRDKTRDLEESLEQQTATAEVLKAISRAGFDLSVVLETLVSTAGRLCGARHGQIFRRSGDVYRYAASRMDVNPAYLHYEENVAIRPGRGTLIGRVALEKRAVKIADAWSDPEYAEKDQARLGGVRAMLGVPLLRDGEPIGAFALARSEPIPFSERQIELVQTFADQAVIAIENARLFEQVQSRTRELEQSLLDLRKAQDRLVQSEKLASLGQLTAGIAHEIKNPLNFVNNFASLSRELLEELRETLGELPAEADEMMGLLDSNLEKVASHGRRADSIVKNMLLHSREGSGERTRVNVNAMVEEALNLGYHGARAEKPGFNVTIEKLLDPQAGDANLYLQEITRVLLNLISNSFYAMAKRGQGEGADYQPKLTASTRRLGESVEIRVRDNGPGVPEEVRAKMFHPFFTTKPAGEGTGLGLSLSHDIIVKQHGGTIEVETESGAFTEIVMTLPCERAKA